MLHGAGRLLAAMPDKDLNTIRQLASGKIKPGKTQSDLPVISFGAQKQLICAHVAAGHAKLSQYLEFQVHGPIRFEQDVAAVVIPERLRKAVTLPPDWQSFLWQKKVYYRRKSMAARLPAGSSGREVTLSCGRRVLAPAYVKAGSSFCYTTAVTPTAPAASGVSQSELTVSFIGV